jgi:tRNA1(Val) A37 N6-methylase TrmN6
VGSGHFLVSALNEIISVKNDLKIFQDRDGKRLKEYQVEVVNDELIVTDEEGELFEYNPSNKESQRIQETLFHEKQTIIENCLFGVDINSNSVKICRLRLWIELLKNAYYKNATELETLPNIDINIKYGNSLVSRFAIDADLKQALKKSKWTIDSYRIAVDTYRNAESKEQKREMERLIADIKSDFRSEISLNDPKVKKLRKLSGDLYQMTNQGQLFEMSKKEKADWNKKVKHLTEETKKLETEIEEIKANKIFENAFEWRFEFPEVLNDDGDFVGFDVVIGNPPYVNSKGEKFENSFKSYALENYRTSKYQIDTYILFIEKAISLMHKNGFMTYIIPNAWLNNLFLSEVRKYIIENMTLSEICSMPSSVFDEAVVDTIILSGSKSKSVVEITIKNYSVNGFEFVNQYKQSDFLQNENNSINIFLDNNAQALISKIESKANKLQSFTSIARGVGVYHKRVGHTKEIISQDPYQSKEKIDNTFVPYLRGKNIKAYVIDWKNDSFISYGKWLAEPREPKYFQGNRILLRQIPGDKLISAFIDSDFITDQSVFIARFENDEINPAGVLGVINSKLLAFYFRNKYSEFDNLFPKVKLQHFKDFPIRTSPEQIFNEICTIVSEIQFQKTNDTNFDLRKLEEVIDQLVYQLYELTEEEIKIIENN